MTDHLPRPDRRLVRASFERAAATYDAAAVLQREVADRLLERLDLVRLEPLRVLDLGAGTGYCTAALARRYKKAQIVALDLAEAMLALARRRTAGPIARHLRGHGCVAGDAERLPFADHSFDLLFSNLTLQWCGDLAAAFGEFRRVLRPGGLLLFTTFGPDTLRELRASWATVDSLAHVNAFLDLHDVGDALLGAGLADPVMDMESITLTYPDLHALMHDLKAIGAHNVNPGRAPGLTGRARLRALNAAYDTWRRPDGLLPATYEVLYGHARAPEPAVAAPRPAARGPASIPLEELRARLRERGQA